LELEAAPIAEFQVHMGLSTALYRRVKNLIREKCCVLNGISIMATSVPKIF
jgi:hypothetical protein